MTRIGCFLLVIAINVLIGGWCLNFVMETVFGKHLPLLVAGFFSLFLGELTIPAAIICWLLTAFGVHTPLIR